MDKRAVKVDGNYELPLPLKDEDMRLPNNRVAAVKRLESLVRKFEKNAIDSSKNKRNLCKK